MAVANSGDSRVLIADVEFYYFGNQNFRRRIGKDLPEKEVRYFEYGTKTTSDRKMLATTSGKLTDEIMKNSALGDGENTVCFSLSFASEPSSDLQRVEQLQTRGFDAGER